MTHTPTRGKPLLIALAIMGCFGINGAGAQVNKAAQHERMIDIQAQIDARKGQAGAAQQLAALQAEFNQISNSLGGDVPCGTGSSSVGSSVSRAPAPSPTGCTAVTTTFTQSTPLAVADVAVTTSTLVVSGAGPYLWDLDVTTFLQHTFAADLDVTITSPAGTVVTLTTDNGAGNDDVFNGTVWDDDANPGGAVPYTTNNGVVTDHAYANLTLASPLVPEESLAAFVGENPNGTWTISISDDLTGDTGTLNSWSMAVTTFASAPIQSAVQSFNQTTAVPIADVALTTSTIAVSGLPAQICKAVVRTNISHTFSADMDITLTSPAGTVVTLSTDNGAGNDNVFAGTTWDDDANPAGAVPYTTNNGVATDQVYANLTTATPLVAEESMGAFMGENGNGTWTLSVSDDLTGDTGSIDSWGLDFITCTCASADISVTLNDAPDPVAAGGNLTYTAVVTNNGPTAATDMSVSLPLPAGLTFVSASASGGGTCAGTGPVVCTWAGSTAAAASQTATIVASVPANAASGTVYTATATASSATGGDPVPGNNTATTTTTVTTSADLLIGLTSSATQVAVNVPVTFTATSLNQGPSDAQDVVVTVTLTPDFRYSSHTATGATCTVPQVGNTGAVVCTWAGTTAVGVTRTLSVVAFSNNEGTSAVNASTSSTTPDPVANNNLANVSVTVGFLVEEIPSLTSLGLVVLGLMLGLVGFVVVRRQA